MPVSFDLSPEQLALQNRVREFAREEILPRAAEIDEKDEFPEDLLKKLYTPPTQFIPAAIPKAYGGPGMSKMEFCIVMEELAYASAACSTLVELLALASGPIILAASEELKRKYLPRIATGEILPAINMTEPEAGSDAAGITTTAAREGDDYILNGMKRYISYADRAHVFSTSVKTDPSKGSKGISLILVEKGAAGFTTETPIRCMGLRGHKAYYMKFENCRVPRANLVGEEGRGLSYLMKTLDGTRLTLGAGYVGLARAAFDLGVKFTKERKTFGRPLMENQAISFPMAELAAEIEASRLLTYKAAWMDDQGLPHTKETSIAKFYAADMVVKVTGSVVSFMGGWGCTDEYPAERYYRDAKTWIFAQGTPLIQRLIVSREIYKD